MRQAWVQQDFCNLKSTEEKLRQTERQFKAIFEVSTVGKFQIDPITECIIRVNKKFCEITCCDPQELLGIKFLKLSHVEDRMREYSSFQRMIQGEIESYSSERKYLRRDGKTIWVNVIVTPIQDKTGRVISAVGVVQDISDKKKMEQERIHLLAREKLMRRNAEFLTAAGKLLASSVDFKVTLKNVSQLVVSHLADWCFLGLIKNTRGVQIVATAAERSKNELVQQLEAYRLDLSAPEGLARAIRFGRPVLYSGVKEAQLYPGPSGWAIVGACDPRFLKVVRKLELKSYIVVPLSIRGRPFGGIFVASTNPSNNYNNNDLELVVELARLCSTALENASLHWDVRKSFQIRDDFISIASHELRTPITPLKMQIQLLKNQLKRPQNISQSDKANLSKLLTDSETQIDRLSKIVENLLDVSRISAGRLVLSFETVNLGDLVNQVISRLSRDLEQANCVVKVAIAQDSIGSWDKRRIEQVVVHFLTNAMKFGRGKTIDVSVENTGPNTSLRITDYGIGIAVEDQAKIFGCFERATSIKSFGGFGLGLYIARKIVEGHDGTISVTSVPGKGSTFTVTLPRMIEHDHKYG
jgi:PAS domain S-box-containing protein